MTTSPECLRFFADIIEREIGIVYSEVNFYQLESRLEDIAKQLGFDGPMALWDKAKTAGVTGSMKLLLIDTATNNETSFFRDPNVFKAIRSVIEGLSAKRRSSFDPIRIWSAACSTGQETYSLAMLFHELQATASYLPYEILATDISERVLKRATEGRYSQLEVQRGLSAAQLVRFFKPEGQQSASNEPSHWLINPDLKRSIQFQKLNLLDPWPSLNKFHLILCRNVLIYQTIDNKKKVVAKLAEQLEPGGYLILGGAESLIGISDALEYAVIDGSVLYHKKIEEQTTKLTG